MMLALGERLRPSTPVKDWVVAPVPRYVRPKDWLRIPPIVAGDQKVIGLCAVFSGSNFVAMTCAGAYTVDWGDGSSPQNVATGVTAYHNFVFTDLSSDTLTSRGFRQALVTITPQAGSNLTSVLLGVKHTSIGSTAFVAGWLDIRMAGSLIAALSIGNSTGANAGLLEQFEFVGPNLVTSFTSLFTTCKNLRSLVALDTSHGTIFQTMFANCYVLEALPPLDTGLGLNFSSMFSLCVALRAVPPLNLASATNLTGMFTGCTNLQSAPLQNTGSCLNFSSLFQNCTALPSVSSFSTASGTNFSAMFQGCTTLQTIPLLDTAAGTNFSGMFNGCISLLTVPLLNTAAGTNHSLMFQSCSALVSVPALDLGLSTNLASIFLACPSLRSVAVVGTKVTISYQNSALGAEALDAIYTALASGVTGQTITVTGNWGVSTDTPSIATAKGWTVTGS